MGAWMWMRPDEFLTDPVLFMEDPCQNCSGAKTAPDAKVHQGCGGPEYSSVKQGAVGDCWFISALATTAATSPEAITNRFIEANPTLGYYVLSFFKHGKWVEVMVDDKLLVLGGKWRGYTTTKLLLGSTLNPDDDTEPGRAIWLPILEKAYAKLHGGYANIEGGGFSYGVRDICGAAPQVFTRQDGSF